jgi:hypothetical protein
MGAVGDRYDVAIAGGNGLLLHRVGDRFTQDLDLFVRTESQVGAVSTAIAEALERNGYTVVRSAEGEDLEAYPPGADGPVQVQVAYFDYHAPVVTEAGPTLSVDDLGAWKLSALCSRHQVRDYADIAQLLAGGYAIPRLVELALALDPGLRPEFFAEAGQHLDENISDRRLAQFLPGKGQDGPWLRALFNDRDWPRDPDEWPSLMGWTEWPKPPAGAWQDAPTTDNSSKITNL